MANPNPFAGVGVAPQQDDIQGLVDQAVILQTALVPKLPEIGITDGMIPIIDQIYSDSGSNSEFVPGTTLNFNFGNAHGKLVDWTQSRLEFDVHVSTVYKQSFKTGSTNVPAEVLALQDGNVWLCLRNGGQVFTQVTFGGAGRPITFNDFEMVALSQSLLKTCESNVPSHIGDISTHKWIGCGSPLPNSQKPGSDSTLLVETHNVVIHVSIPLTTVMPMFGTVDNYLLSTTSGIELRLTVTTNNTIFCYTAPTEVISLNNKTGWFGWKWKDTTLSTLPFYGQFVTNPVSDIPVSTEPKTLWSIESKLVKLTNVHCDIISTQHPDDYILNMLNGICSTRGLFYPNQMTIATPFNLKVSEGVANHYQLLVPVVSGYRNIDSVFCWFTKRGDLARLVKLPMINVYTSLNGTFKTPIHGYRDHVYQCMTETAAQFNRAFGTVNSTILAPMEDIMKAYTPNNSSFIVADSDKAAACKLEFLYNDSFVANCSMWELEKSSWMNGPDFSQHSNKYQIVFDLENVTENMAGDYTFWVVHRFDSYTHVYNGYINLLTTKEEVAMALAQAQAGQAIAA